MFETTADGHLTIDLPHAKALFTSRRGGVSGGPYASLNLGWLTDDDGGDVARNRERAAELVGTDTWLYGRQVHGTAVRVADAPPPSPPPDEDGQVTAMRDAAAMVLVADCLPVALASAHGVAALHGGWRGLAGGILEEGVRLLRGLGDGEIAAAIGPGAGGCCYEVGDEVHDAFPGIGTRGTGRTIDLKKVARVKLEAAGVQAVHDSGLCTMCAADADGPVFFSHRRDGGVTGRQAGFVWRA